MNLMDSFNNFYNNLSFNGLFFFWIVVFLFVLLTILLIVLAVKNNKLSKLLKERQDNIINQNICLSKTKNISTQNSYEAVDMFCFYVNNFL